MLAPFRMGVISSSIRSSSAGAGDLYFGSVVTLLHFNGSNGSTSFVDVKGRAWTANGNVNISTAQSKFGGSSAYFDGTDDFLSAPSSADFGFGTGDFTVECWLYRQNSECLIWDNRTANGQPMTCFVSASGQLSFFDTSNNSGSPPNVQPNVWTHVAWCRAAGIMRMFVDGVMVYSGAHTLDFGSSRPIRIGCDKDGNADLQGYIDEFRVTKGVGRYTADFTPPASPFPDA